MGHIISQQISRNIFNYTGNPVYVVDKTNTYTLNPMPKDGIQRIAAVYVMTTTQSTPQWNMFGSSMKNEYYFVKSGYPTVIPDLGMVIFHSKEEMDKEVKRFSNNLQILISAYLGSFNHIMKGSYRVVCRLTDRPYYFATEEGEIFEIPKADEAYRDYYLQTKELDVNRMEDEDLLLIMTVATHSDYSKPAVVSTRHLWVPKGIRTFDEPLISMQNGLLLFNDIATAERFVQNYDGSFLEYLIVESRNVVKDQFEKAVRQAKEEGKAGRRQTVEFIGAIAISGLVGVLADRGVDMLVKSLGKKKK